MFFAFRPEVDTEEERNPIRLPVATGVVFISRSPLPLARGVEARPLARLAVASLVQSRLGVSIGLPSVARPWCCCALFFLKHADLPLLTPSDEGNTPSAPSVIILDVEAGSSSGTGDGDAFVCKSSPLFKLGRADTTGARGVVASTVSRERKEPGFVVRMRAHHRGGTHSNGTDQGA